MGDGISNDKIYEVLLDIKGGMGELRASVANGHEFTQAVSGKADKIRAELVEHTGDNGAHGRGSEQKALAKAAGLIVGCVALIEGVLYIWKAVKHS